MSWKQGKDFSIPPRKVIPPPNSEKIPQRRTSIGGLPMRNSVDRVSLVKSDRFDRVTSASDRIYSFPSRTTSSIQVPIDDLLNDGVNQMSVPNSNYEEAIERWNHCLQLAAEEQDMIRQAKAYSNIGCAYRNLGKLVEAKQHLDKSWNLTTSYIRSAAAKEGSNWLQLAIRATGLDGDKIENAFVTHSKDDSELSKKPSIKSNTTLKTEISQGPPIVVWILQLMTNMGNLCFSRGKYEAAIKCHSIVKRLVESIFEEYPPPPEILQCSLDANNMGSPKKSIDGKKCYQLSYVHRHAIIAQAMALTHLGTCFGALGVAATCLQYHKAAHNLLKDVAEYVPGFVPNTLLSPRTSSATTSSSVEARFSSNIVRYRACISSNIGIGWHLMGDFAKSAQWHQKSLELFEYHGQICRKKSFGGEEETRTVGLDETRQNSQLAAMYAQLGISLLTVHWLHKMEISHNADFFSTALACRYWRGSLKKDQIPTHDLSKWLSVEYVFDKALGILYEQAYRQRIFHDWNGLFVTWLNIASNHPDAALHYVGRVVSGADGVVAENSGLLSAKPTLPVSMHQSTYLLICQILFALCHSTEYKVSDTDAKNIHDFLTKNVPNSKLDLFRLTKEMVVEFCSNIVDKIKSFQTSLSSPAVLPFAKIYYPIEDDQPFHEEYKIDSTKLCLLRLAFTQAKLAWSIGSVNPLKFIDLYKEGSQIAITSIMEALGIQKRTIGIPKEYLLRIADHLSSDAQSPALADGCLDYNQYALVADMLGFILSHPEMTDLAIKLQVVPESMLQIREGLVQGCRTLLLTYLNVCEDCFFKLYTCNVYFEKHSQGSGVVVPCPHGFVLSHI